MENVLLEYRIKSRPEESFRAQILEDGTYRIWSEGVMEPQEAQWRIYASLNPERLNRLKDAIKNSNFFGLKESYAPENEPKGGGTTVWFASLDGQNHQVTVVGTSAVSVPELDSLKAVMDTVTQEALDERHQ